MENTASLLFTAAEKETFQKFRNRFRNEQSMIVGDRASGGPSHDSEFNRNRRIINILTQRLECV